MPKGKATTGRSKIKTSKAEVTKKRPVGRPKKVVGVDFGFEPLSGDRRVGMATRTTAPAPKRDGIIIFLVFLIVVLGIGLGLGAWLF